VPEFPWEDGPAEVRPGSLQGWVGQAVSGILDLSGPCPRCTHDSTFSVHKTAIVVTASAAPDILGTDGQDAFNAATLLMCQCGQPHAHPKKLTITGCGAYWVARPTKVANENRYGLEPVKEPKLVAAARLVGKESVTTQAGLRTLAEKWIPGIAAIVGVLGLAGLVVSKDAVDGLSQEWRTVAFVLVAMAVVAAVIATVLVYRAAFGWPATVPLGTDAEVLEAAEKLSGDNAAIVKRLRSAVGWSVAAVVALLGALGIFWLQPDSTRPTKVTFTENDSETTACGKITKISNGALHISVTDGAVTTVQVAPLTIVSALEQVADCGG